MMGRTIASRELAGAWVFFPGEVHREQEAVPHLGTSQGSAPAPTPPPHGTQGISSQGTKIHRLPPSHGMTFRSF